MDESRAMAAVTDVQVRILGEADPNTPGLRKVEVTVDGSGRWDGTSRFLLDALDPDEPQAYGVQLGQQLANPNFVRALDQAGLTRNGTIRLRLVLDEDSNLHWVRWERVWLRVGGADQRLATYDRTLFSRYIDVQQSDEEPPDALFFRLLYAISNPTGLTDNEQIKVECELTSFLDAFQTTTPTSDAMRSANAARTSVGVIDRRLRVSILPGQASVLSDALKNRIQELGWTILSGATTLQNVAKQLAEGYHGLHILSHGMFDPAKGIGRLLLESDDGSKSWTEDAQLQAWMNPQLQLVLLQACQGAQPQAEGKPPFTGLAPRLIKLGVPAVIAMQDLVAMKDARTFCASFYRTLLDEGFVDLAVNRARKQLLESDNRSDAFSIPALFTRLKGGKLWQPDALRQTTRQTLEGLPENVDDWPPFDVIEHTRGVAEYQPLQGAVGPQFDFWTHIRELGRTSGSFVAVTGPTGSFRANQLQRVFKAFGQEYLEGTSEDPSIPILLTLRELAGESSVALPMVQRTWRGEQTAADTEQMTGRRFLFLIDAEEDPGGYVRDRALTALNRLASLPKSGIILLAPETLLGDLASTCATTKLLVVQLLDWPKVKIYLEKLNTPVSLHVHDVIRDRRYTDLASHPRFLQHMLDLAKRDVKLQSRCAILGCVADVYLRRSTRVPRAAVEAALQNLAWELQTQRATLLSAQQLYPQLSAARGARELPLPDLLLALVSECGLLVPGADESVRFAYPPLQAYFAAQYVAKLPDRRPVLEDIAASLGRLARLRRWENVLVLLAGMLPSPGDLLRTILAGSSLMEGEQLFVAARCYQEAIARESKSQDLDAVLEQMIDALMWRSTYDGIRPYADRVKAVTCLTELASFCASMQEQIWAQAPPAWWRQRRVLAHLVAISVDPAPRMTETQSVQYDFSGMRRYAATGLLELYNETTQYLQEARPALLEPVEAWKELQNNNSEHMRQILCRDDPGMSVVAAFALTQSPHPEEDRQALLDAYDHVENPDVLWAISDALAGLDVSWLHTVVIDRWLHAPEEPGERGRLRPIHVCHLVERTSLAASSLRDRLTAWLKTGPPVLQGHVLRAFGALQDPDVEEWLRPLCEQILCGTLDEHNAARMTVTADTIKYDSLQGAALETLRGIGDAGSINIIRSSRATRGQSARIRQLSFQVVEEMYWRLTEGLDKETYTDEAFQRPTR